MRYNIDFISSTVKSFMKDKRYIHTIGVAEEAYVLGKIYLPDKLDKLYVSGLLHDITKEFTVEKHIELCRNYNIVIDKENLISKLLHSKTGAFFSRELFGKEIVDDEIFNAITYHTTGRKNMTLFEAILYLADFIEKNRKSNDCVKIREYFYKNIEKAKTQKEKLIVLRETMILSFDVGISILIEEGKQIDNDTIQARNYFLVNENIYMGD